MYFCLLLKTALLGYIWKSISVACDTLTSRENQFIACYYANCKIENRQIMFTLTVLLENQAKHYNPKLTFSCRLIMTSNRKDDGTPVLSEVSGLNWVPLNLTPPPPHICSKFRSEISSFHPHISLYICLLWKQPTRVCLSQKK